MDVIVFGMGEVGRGILPYLDKDCHILFFVDNDKKKWNTVFEGYSVKCPDEIKYYNCDVVIASTKYKFEILRQLQKMKVGQKRIYLSYRVKEDSGCEYEIYPLMEEKIKCTGKSLVQYDLCHAEEHKTNYIKVLVFCSFFSLFTKQVIENMSKRYRNIEFSLLTCAKESKEKIISEQLKHIYYFRSMSDLKTILKQLPIYDVAQLLWIENEWSHFYHSIRRKVKRLNLHVGGSEFYRAGVEERNFKKNLIDCADYITVQAEKTKDEFGAFYGEKIKEKTIILPLGIEVLEFINLYENLPKPMIKEKFHIPLGKVVVTCGHNASVAHQHLRIIEGLKKLPEGIKQQLVCIFPMTYPRGCDAYINDIRSRLDESELEYVILTEFMDFHEMAMYALISDVMIHVQTTDALSSAMREEMYAGSVVIAGKWLPYQTLHDREIFFLDVDTVSDVMHALENVILNIEEYKRKCTRNKEIIWNHSSWDAVAPKWYALWN